MTNGHHHLAHEGDANPVSAATLQLAEDIHEELLNNLAGGSGENGAAIDAIYDKRRLEYPHALFGELALHIADVKLPQDATAPDRARGISEALRRIAVTPSLLEAVTNAPFTTKLADEISQTGLAGLPERQPDEAALELQRKVAEKGYFTRSMVSAGRVLRLEYATTEAMKNKRFGGATIPQDTSLTLTVIATNAVWQVKQFSNYSYERGFSGYVGTREETMPVFKILLADTDAAVPNSLEKLVKLQRSISVGEVIKGSPFNIRHTFKLETEELRGQSESSTSSSKLSLPAKLQQIYADDSSDYPLFPY